MTDYELKAKAELFKEGAREVIKAGGSFGVFDLWAIFETELRCIQVKETKFQLRFAKLIEQIRLLKLPLFCTKWLWIWYSYRSKRVNKKLENYKGWKKILIN